MSVETLLEEKAEEIKRIAARHGACNVRVFGSTARGESLPDSDIDFLVEVAGSTSAWFPGGLILDLQELLGRRVEVVTEKWLNPDLRDHVLNEAVEL